MTKAERTTSIRKQIVLTYAWFHGHPEAPTAERDERIKALKNRLAH